MDSFLLSSGAYKVNAKVAGVPLNDCSFISSNDAVIPFFEESVSNDPDITSLIISIKSDSINVSDWMLVYSLKKETEQYNGAIFIESLDADIPSFKIPSSLPMGHYSMVFQIMSRKDVLQRTERDFFYLKDSSFSYDGISINLPGIAENSQMISKGQVVMLETKINFDERLDPYIVWFNGRNRISEGRFSDGAGNLLWKAPDQSNFFPLRAEVFPVRDFEGLSGYKNEVSVLVSSNTQKMNLVSESVSSLLHWYVFDGNLLDSKNPSSESRAIRSAAGRRPRWMSANGTYGLATGSNSLFSLPVVSVAQNGNWQLLFRVKPVNNGSLMTVNFDNSSDTSMDLSIRDENVVLTLSSYYRETSHVYPLPFDRGSFITMGLNFSVASGQILARLNVLGENMLQNDFISQGASIQNNFQIILGEVNKNKEEEDETIPPVITAIWDEFAVYNNPSMDLIATEIKTAQINNFSNYEF